MDPGAEACCSATARALDMFNRRGSVIAVVIGGRSNNTTDILPACMPSTSSAGVGAELVSTSSDPENQPSTSGTQPQHPVNPHTDWRPLHPRLIAFHDCLSLAAGWSLGLNTTNFDDKPTGASQAQSPCEDDSGDGKCNELLASCPAFRNELGNEPVRRLALSRWTADGPLDAHPCETWMREHTAAEAGILEDVSNVYLGGRLCANRQAKNVIEPQDIGSYYYRHCFAGRRRQSEAAQHQTLQAERAEFFGVDEDLGPIAISMAREEERIGDPCRGAIYRLIIRISDLRTMRLSVPESILSEQANNPETRSNRPVLREILEMVTPRISFGCLKPAVQASRTEDTLMKIDEQPIYTRYKVGVMLCRADQSTEEQMYNNEHTTEAFEEFLDFLGQRVRLKGWDQYKGGLDTRGDTTGTHSVYTEYQAHEIMFHVCTLLPYTPSNKQQLSRKRHIGNDMVTIVFQEPGALPFSPITVRSHFQHVFIVVQVHNALSDSVSYSVAVSRSKEVPAFGPPIPGGALFGKSSDFHDWLMTKIINAENAVHRSKKFATMAARTRREALKDLCENYVVPHADASSRIASRFLGGSVKRREKSSPKPDIVNMRGALSWAVDVYEYSSGKTVSCVMGISQETVVLLERPSGAVIFNTPTHSILGWAHSDNGLKLWYDHGDQLLIKMSPEGNQEADLNCLIIRLMTVTKGEEAKEIILRRQRALLDAWGFHLQEEGIVTDVEMYQNAWKAGLRQGSRIIEIEDAAVVTMSIDRINQVMQEEDKLRMLMISPAADGSPRRGCEDPNCPAVRGEHVVLTSDAFVRQPVSYQAMFRMRNREYASSATSSPASSLDEHFKYAPFSYYPTSLPSRAQTHASSSVHDHMCLLLHAPLALNRAQSDEHLRISHEHARKAPLSARESTNDCEVNEMNSIQLHLKRIIEEKRAAEMMIVQLRKQLNQERQAHEITKRELERLRTSYEKK